MLRFVLLVGITCFAICAQSERDLMRKAVHDFMDHQSRLGDYSFQVKVQSKEFFSDGKLKSETLLL